MHSEELLSTSLLSTLYSTSIYNYLYNLHLGLRTFIKYKTSVEIKIKTKRVTPLPQNSQILDYDGFEGKPSQASGILCCPTVCCHPVI